MLSRLCRDAWRMIWPLLLAAVASAWRGDIVPLAIVLGVLLVWQVWQKWRLARWLARGELLDPPHAGGLWEDYYTRLMHLFRREQTAQQSLRAVIDRARDAADSLSEGVLLLNRRNELEYGNLAAFELLDLRQRDRGEVLVKLLRYPALRSWLLSRDFQHPLTLPAPQGSGTLCYRAVALDNGDVLMRVEDISRLQHLETLRQDFVANVSHELKTPLTVFKGYLELLDELLVASPLVGVAEALHGMQVQSLRMENLVRELLLLARLEGTVPKSLVSLDIQRLIGRLRPGIEKQAAEKQQKIDWQLADGLLLNGIANELESAVGNLLGNAIAYTPNGGSIQVRSWRDMDGVHLAVTDSGPGIATHHLPHLTERFYRVDKSRNSGTGGTGLGLAIVKHVLERHGAYLSIDSELGKGSCFTCHFPRAL